MGNIKDRIKDIKEYFVGMKVENVDGYDFIYVTVKFPYKWKIDKNFCEQNGITVIDDNEKGYYHFCAVIDTGFDAIFDAIDNTIKKMLSAEERVKLLKEKILELQELFEDDSISTERLKNYMFVYKPKKKTIKSVPEEKEITTNLDNVVENNGQNTSNTNNSENNE